MMKKGSIEELLLDAQLTIEGTLKHPGICREVAEFGYNQKRLLAGQTLYLKSVALYETQIQEYLDKEGATDTSQQVRQELDTVYKRHYRIAKAVLEKQDVHWKAMQLHGPRKKPYPAWLKQVKAFYRHIGPVADVMAKHGVGAEEVAQVQAMLQALTEAKVQQKHHKSGAQRATKIRDNAFDELREWVRDYKTIAKIALKKDKQLLEAIGIVTS